MGPPLQSAAPPRTPGELMLKPAATLILLRDADPSPEVLLIERHARSSVLPAMTVFPGGGVQQSDAALAGHMGPFTEGDARALLETIPGELALAYCVAALRETFEEVGLLLARRRGESGLIGGNVTARLQSQRLDLQAARLDFRELVAAEGLELAVDCLCAHGHWVTPETVTPRFDTIFFTALAPAGQQAQADGVESTQHVWLRPEEALEQARRGERRMIFPTACNLESLCGFSDARSALEASRARRVVRVQPSIVMRDGQRVIDLPLDSGYRIAAGFERAPGGAAPPRSPA
jgi:8-oxo-dGTP pyrophosphatase MutT (NUDIX family)